MVPARPQRMLDQNARYLSADTTLRGELLPSYLSTPCENRALMRYQRTDKVIDPLTVYGKSGVKLVSITRTELSTIKARDLHAIEQLLEKAY